MKFLRHRRGLSNVVTAAMLLTGVVIMGTGIVSWSKGNLNAFQLLLVNTSVNATNKINENLVIENVAFCKNCQFPAHQFNVIEATLTNTGTLPLKVTQIQINSTVIQTYFSGGTSLPATISPQQSYLVESVLPGSMVWGSGKPSTIAVTTARGSIFTTQAAAP